MDSPSDALVNLRQFVGGLNAALNDQSYAGQDSIVYNPTGQFQTVGPQGTAVEGKPIALTSAGGLSLSPGMVLLLAGAVAAFVLMRG